MGNRDSFDTKELDAQNEAAKNDGSWKKAKQRSAPVEGSAPDGFNIPVGRDRGDGWVLKEEGTTVQGRLLGLHTMKQLGGDGNKRQYFQVKLDRPVKAIQSLNEDDEGYNEDDEEANRIEVELEAGDTVNIDVSAMLKDLAPFFTDGNTYNIWFQYVRQEKQLRNMWRIRGPNLQRVNT